MARGESLCADTVKLRQARVHLNPFRMEKNALKTQVRLLASPRRYLPPSAGATSGRIHLPAGATIADVFEKLGIPAAAHLTLVNGFQESNTNRELEDGCTLSVFSPGRAWLGR